MAYEHEKLTVSNTAVAPSTTPDSYDRVEIWCEDQPVRLRWDGTDPTASVGHLMLAGERFVLTDREALMKLKAIRSGGTDGVLSMTFGPSY